MKKKYFESNELQKNMEKKEREYEKIRKNKKRKQEKRLKQFLKKWLKLKSRNRI